LALAGLRMLDRPDGRVALALDDLGGHENCPARLFGARIGARGKIKIGDCPELDTHGHNTQNRKEAAYGAGGAL
jgi:hypothetical protein